MPAEFSNSVARVNGGASPALSATRSLSCRGPRLALLPDAASPLWFRVLHPDVTISSGSRGTFLFFLFFFFKTSETPEGLPLVAC